MADFQKLAQFIPALKPLEMASWYEEHAVRAKGTSHYHFISSHEKEVLDRIQCENLTVEQINEAFYGLTNKISPLRTIQFLSDIEGEGLLENGNEWRSMIPEMGVKKPPHGKSFSLMTVLGVNARAGVGFSILFFLSMAVLGLLDSGILPAPSLYPFGGSFLYSLLIIPVAVLLLANLRGIFSMIVFMLLGVKGDFVLYFRCGMPVFSMEKRAIISSPASIRRLYHVVVFLFFPFVALLLSAVFPYVPGRLAVVVREIFWISGVLFLFDLYLLWDSRLILMLEEFSMESSLGEKFKAFWEHGFATIESLYQKRFPKEEIFYGIGILQILWFLGYCFVFFYVLNENIPELKHLRLEHGPYIFIPPLVVAVAGPVFFLLAFIPFLLKKTAGLTVSLLDLGSRLVQKEKGRVAEDASVDLKRIHVFSLLSDEEIKKIEEHVTVAQYDANEVLVREGERGDTLFAIRRGQAVVTKRDSRGREKELAALKEGNVFGERAILGEGERTATVKSLTPIELYIIPKEIFSSLCEGLGERSWISQMLMAANAIKNTPALSDLPPQTILSFASHAVLERFNAGRTIFRKGDESNGIVYIVKKGEAAVAGAGPDGSDVVLKANDYFGEIALLSDSPRTATVTARTDMEVFAFRKAEFLALLFSNFPSLLEIETTEQKRLSELAGNRP